jgi:hypothetical protein
MSTEDDVFCLYERNSSWYHDCNNFNNMDECPTSFNKKCYCYLNQTVKPSTIGDQSDKCDLKRKIYIIPTQECSICLEPIDRKKDAYLTSCGHGFHKGCIYKTFETKMITKYASQFKCPLCRTKLGYDLGNLNDRYNTNENTFTLDDLENFWIRKNYTLPQLCSTNWKHYIGFNMNCSECLQYIKCGNKL